MKIIDIFPELNNKQLDRLSEFLANFSLLLIATLVLPNLFGVNMPNMVELNRGILIALASLIISLVLIKRIK
ncbi:hypothetical protein A3B42_01015 [Candidatus Daviesbacteria bacterium RIFCSPLOWO2_01_FULL_38_10]|uniref:Uncharacterized protein n=1 Tax=Candidatus Daviesbacteria bacterium GW2011_GWF2_38_6 TaxID=1618432 RepID=A0A0G0KAP5_9BACT|nr:MAG: hypothetical protein US80_C0003G0046 [Candidatus Daviesbacteria bacterium GW2011_GWA2_38_17]KKQ76723.1 MAG: hypothetical protein US99_C0063G0010 [Candidatus Daviesbacteria bacterium GW2011_GWF2_38_6]OGE26039.1 MAG: hypothetical protein A3D02_03345 [Candidatus Daviesbacteria bacterium RIFCSPHIGHO2_02_FULL_39_41]OGE37310.1 MAG: hypothetical protein A3B42_01015 [Candidatus Daviesbacteria bacterium RIFCSPLOWO2_01_FULL_38_10]OGE44852.1 MAG: hypothetical protein A3E67_00380 [Candidatus Davies